MSVDSRPIKSAEDDSCPPGWHETLLSSVAEIRFSSVDKKSESGEKPVRLCNYTNVYNNEYVTSDMEFMHASATLAEIDRFGVRVGDVIITKDSETPDDIGVPAVIDSTAPDLVCGYHLALIRPRQDKVDPTFLAKQLGHTRIVRYFGRQANGSTRYGLSTASIAGARLRLPELTQQRAVSRIIRLLDAAIAKTAVVIAKLKQVRAGLLHDLLTRGLDDNGELRDPDRYPEQFQNSQLGKIPNSWRVASVGEIVAQDRQGILTGPFGVSLGTNDFVDAGVPVLQVGNVQSGYIDISDAKYVTEKKAALLARYRVCPGDLLFARSGATTGRNALADNSVAGAIINYHIIRVAVDRTQCDPRFLFACFNSAMLSGQIHSAKGKGTREGINSAALSGFVMPLPPVNEQTRSADQLAAVDETLAITIGEQGKLRELKSGLMLDLLTGRVLVPENQAV